MSAVRLAVISTTPLLANSVSQRNRVREVAARAQTGRTADPEPMTTLRIRWREGALLIVPGTLALMFFVEGSLGPGLVLAALVAIGFASRAQIAERNEAGGHARTKSILLSVQATALAAIYLFIVVLFFLISREHWTRDRHGTVAVYALAGLAFFIVREWFLVVNGQLEGSSA
jgi:hypothetical protein